MRKTTQLFLLAMLMFLLSLFEAVSGFVLWLVLPRGAGKRLEYESTFLWTRDTWIDLHDWVAVALLVIIVVHLIVHWKWIVHMIKTCCRPKQP